MRLHWEQITRLREHAGHLELDSGNLFVRFHGCANGGDYYDGEPVFAAPNVNVEYKQFSLSGVIGNFETIATKSEEVIVNSGIENEELTDDGNSSIDGLAEDQAGTDGGWDR